MNERAIRDALALLARFGPYVLLTVMVVGVVGVIPDDDSADVGTEGASADADPADAEGGADFDSDALTSADSGSGDFSGGVDASGATTGGRSGPSGSRGTGTTSGGGGSATDTAQQTSSAKPAPVSGPVANCDPQTGRIAIPSKGAPACVSAFSGDNGGNTHRGVSADTIRVAVFRARQDPAADAILSAAGAGDPEENKRTQFQEWADFYEAHYETYGRELELVFVEASGGAGDDAAGRADAIKVADKIKAFASLGSPNNAYTDELAARGVMCFACGIGQPNEYFESRAPYVWEGLMSSTQMYTHVAEYLCKRVAFKPAEFAGDPVIASKERAFGLLWYEVDSGAFAAGTRFFNEELAGNCGLELASQAQFKGFPDLAANQEQARPLIQKMKADDVTSIVMSADPFAPIFFTQEATRQQYFPEWIVTGSALTDSSFFGRTYDQAQWANAFGLGALPGRLPEEKTDAYRLLQWHYGRGPTAESNYAVIRSGINIFFTGVHYAGPNLDPGSFRDGIFNAPPSNPGGITSVETSFGVETWGFPDFNSYDSVAELWWDPQAQGEDEIGNDGIGLYRYADMGKRYLPGQHPAAPTKAFQPGGTITIYQDYPEVDRPPDYPPPR